MSTRELKILPDMILAASSLSFAALAWGGGSTQLKSAPPPELTSASSSKQLTIDSSGNWRGYADAHRGNYFGLVRDTDPNGLNCRMRGQLNDYDRIFVSNPDILSMPVVTTLPHGTEFNLHAFSAIHSRIYILVEDNRGLPWVYNADDNCFVRANTQYLDFIVYPR
jgi:hypothetical protein